MSHLRTRALSSFYCNKFKTFCTHTHFMSLQDAEASAAKLSRAAEAGRDILFGHWDTRMAKCTAIGIYANGDIYVCRPLPCIPFSLCYTFLCAANFQHRLKNVSGIFAKLCKSNSNSNSHSASPWICKVCITHTPRMAQSCRAAFNAKRSNNATPATPSSSLPPLLFCRVNNSLSNTYFMLAQIVASCVVNQHTA